MWKNQVYLVLEKKKKKHLILKKCSCPLGQQEY